MAPRPRRTLTWAALCVLALHALAAHAAVQGSQAQATAPAPASSKQIDQEQQALEAYNEALDALQALSPPSSRATHQTPPPPTSFLSALFPNAQGPVATTIRIGYRLRQQVTNLLIPKVIRGEGKQAADLSGKAVKALDLLEYAAEIGNHDALYKLAQISLFPPASLPMNASRAFHSYQRHAAQTGNATSQFYLGFFYASGYGGVVPVDQAKALLYYTFAAHGGEISAKMVLGYRYWAGIGVRETCRTALEWYEAAAGKSISEFYAGPPGGRTLPRTHVKLSDLVGGVYGPGASVASTGANANRASIKAATARAAGETWEDLLEYYQYHADRNEIEFALRLGKIFYQGSIYASAGGAGSGAEGVGAIPQDFHRARGYFYKVTRSVWQKDVLQFTAATTKDAHLKRKDNVDDTTGVLAASAAAYIGRMYLRGEGVKPDARVAKMWFERGMEFGERESYNGLGIIARDGLVGGRVDTKLATAYFKKAAGQDLAEAQVNLGKAHFENRNEWNLATPLFEAAIRNGSPYEPYYYIAAMHSEQAHVKGTTSSVGAGSCGYAVSFFKWVAERGSWSDDFVSEAQALWDAGGEQNKEGAKLRWWIAAERGSEIAQSNLAYILDQDTSSFRTRYSSPPSNETAHLALIQWTRAAAQRNIDALVKVGDYYYRGLGVSDEPEPLRWEKAAGYYHSAADSGMSALAMWNLGWMYENGAGVAQDFHLAKRYYDHALAINSEAYAPVTLSLIRLYLRSLWHTLSGGTQKGLTLWTVESDEDQWYLGKAKDRWAGRTDGERGTLDGEDYGQAREDDDDDDPVRWAWNRRQEEVEQARAEEADAERGYGRDDYFMGLSGDDDVDEFWETMFLVLLCAAIAGLLYARTRWAAREARRREEEEQRRAAGGGGQPPRPPADPWAVIR
ncbi:hypothetical protein BOTBODRAFT_142608 [Botryobasidium botryosum FD-172 SS1]|uniref:HCP-like protein n=1 Tax=Botryobasidium botryosum (strain FD-172 SS1) TaxID=930990 RepID=A0A067N869_BOTB1|nr:hypothetical protein BOTBODRAFT_142608 [Botryobasidium botryosum FD-172 SS1]